jgi:hypothetical protein
MTKYNVNGKDVDLLDRHFIYEGGEGRVYSLKNTVYKIYIDPSRMIPDKKIQELSVITDPKRWVIL